MALRALKSYFVALILFTALALISPIANSLAAPPTPAPNASGYGQPGTSDFIEYWSAYQLFIQNKNPYDPKALYEIQQQIGRQTLEPLMMWNPPWLLTLMTPVLQWDFLTASRIWLGINCLLVLVVGIFSWRAAQNENFRGLACALAAVLFFGVWDCIGLGQTSLVLAASLAGIIYGLKQNRDWLVGALLVPLTIKPHIVYLVLIALAWWVFRERRYAILGSFLAVFIALILLTTLQSSDSLSFWIMSNSALPSSSQAVIAVPQWRVATLVGIVRQLINQTTGSPAYWPMAAIPGACAIALLVYLIRRKDPVNWSELMPPILCLSVFTSPYGWVFDQSVLAVPQVMLVALSFKRRVSLEVRLRVLGLLAALLATVTVLHACCFKEHHQFWWVSFVFLVIWHCARKQLSRFD